MNSLRRDMSSPDESISYLDLGGNFVVWAGDGNTVALHGHHFHEIITLLTFVISASCLVAFIAIMAWIPCVYLSRKPSRRILKWYGACLSALCMTCYFLLDVVNRVFHELELEFSSYYVAIDIPTSKLASLGELLLLFALLFHLSPVLESNVNIDLHSSCVKWGEICIVILVVLLNLVGEFQYIYNFVAYNLGPPQPGGFSSGDNTLTKVLGSYPWINATLYAVYLLGAICFAIHSLLVIRALHRADTFCKALRVNIPLLAATFFTRSLVSLVFVMVFGLSGRWATFTQQLIHMAFYGPLTVIIYASIVRIAAIEDSEAATVIYAPVEHAVSKDWVGWQEWKQGYVHVNEMPPVPPYSTTYPN